MASLPSTRPSRTRTSTAISTSPCGSSSRSSDKQQVLIGPAGQALELPLGAGVQAAVWQKLKERVARLSGLVRCDGREQQGAVGLPREIENVSDLSLGERKTETPGNRLVDPPVRVQADQHHGSL